MRITIALLLVATTATAGTVAHSTANVTSQQKPWTPMTNKQDGGDSGESQEYHDPSQQILVIAPAGREAGVAGEGLSYTYQLPARGEVINTAPKEGPHGALPQGVVNSHAMLQPAGSGVVLQIHPQYLKGYPPTSQNVKPGQGHGGYNRNPQVAGTQVALQIQPQFVLTGVHNPNLLHKQIQAPIYYNTNQPLSAAPVAVNYPNHLLGGGGVRPGQQVLAAPPLTPPNPGVLAQLAAAQYPQLFPANQHVKVQNHPLGTKTPPPLPQPHLQHAVAGETKVRPHVRDTSSEETFPDFGKMFESYFKTGGPFGHSFRNDNPENVRQQTVNNLKINTDDDFPTGDFFGDPDKSKAASNNQLPQQQNDGGFQPCDFFKAANQKVVGVGGGSEEDEDSEQFSSDKHAAREPNHRHFGPPRGGDETRHQTKTNRYRDNRDDDDSDENKSGPGGNSHRQEHRDHDDESDEDSEESPRQHQRYRPSQSQKSQSYRGKKESDDDESDEEENNNRRPANFHHHHHHDGRPSPQKKNQNNGGSQGRPSHEHVSGSHYGRPSQEHSYHGRPSQEQSSVGNHGRPSQDYNSGRQEHNEGGYQGRPSQEHSSVGNHERPSQDYNSGRQEHNEGGYQGRPSQEHSSVGYHGRPSQEHNGDRQHAGRASNQRPNSESREVSRPSYGHNNHQDDEDDDDDEDSVEHRGGRTSSSSNGQNSHRHAQQEAKPPAVRTFHTYNFPPAPDYSRDVTAANNNNNHDNRRPPPPPVKEPDTLAYYTYVTPVLGNSGIYYRSEKEMISRNNTMSIE